MKELVKQINRQSSWDSLPELSKWVIEEGIHIQQIPAPTFSEEERASYVARQFKKYKLGSIEIDAQKNVYGVVSGLNPLVPGIMVMAHTDTVFPIETDLTIRREESLIFGPALGDNSMGVSGMLGIIKWLNDKRIKPECDIWFVATSCEEGLGDLRGIRMVYERLKSNIGAVINIEGLAFGHIYHAGIAVHRMHITASAEGGHSWLHFGRPSAIHGIIELGSRIIHINPPSNPRTTFNIGLIDGGQTINSIASKASLWLDLRSEDTAALKRIQAQVLDLVRKVEIAGLTFSVEVVGDRPAGSLKARHPLVQGAVAALAEVNIRPTLETGSTDGNIPLFHGCPTVTIGITRGGNAHRLDEFIETIHVEQGMRQLIILTLAAASYQSTSHEKIAGD